MKKLIIFLLVASMLTGCENSSPDTLKIGLVTWVGYTPFYVAQEKGFFRKNGVNVELSRIEDVGVRRQAIASGKLDAVALTLDALIVARDNGIPVKGILALDQSNGGDGIIATNNINEVSDLRGKRVAYQKGQPSQLFLHGILKSEGMSFNDIEPVFMDADKAGSAFIAGQLDAAVTWEPWLTIASQQGKGNILADSRKTPGLIIDILYAHEVSLVNKKVDFEALIKSWYEAVEFTLKYPEEAKAIISKSFNLDKENVDIIFPKVRFLGKSDNLNAFGTLEHEGDLYLKYREISDTWLNESVIKNKALPADGLMPAFVRSGN